MPFLVRNDAPPSFSPARSAALAPRMLVAVLLVAGLWMPAPALAGGGPENVMLVVNGASWASRTVANQYCEFRQIPATNVMTINWTGSLFRIDVDTFRQHILQPILEEMERRKLARQIDYIIYSSDFPLEIDFSKDLPEGQNTNGAVASITSLTYLGQLVMAKRHEYMGLTSNWYMRSVAANGDLLSPSRAFRSAYFWSPQGARIEKNGMRYAISTMLACTSGEANSVAESVRCLRTAALADGTQPRGTIYLMRSSDVRSTTRSAAFESVVKQLGELGVKAEILDGALPRGKQDVQGAVLGVARFDWAASGSVIRPGALCENLTSFGGLIRETQTQTKLFELLRNGAAGASGTVIEPYALQAKFPHPIVQVHYANGCSLGEAFYQSVHGPYQLLIVGDPLCQPWAQRPRVAIDGITHGQTVSGQVVITPQAQAAGQARVGQFRLFLDGRLIAERGVGESLGLNTSLLPDGYHELRVVAIDDSLIETQGRAVISMFVNNRDRQIACAALPDTSVTRGKKLTISANSPGSTSIHIYCHQQLVGKIDGEVGDWEFDPTDFGLGKVRLAAVGLGEKPEEHVYAEPIEVLIKPATALPQLQPAPTDLASGLSLERADGTRGVVTSSLAVNFLAEAGVKSKEPFQLTGYFSVPQDDVYQFQAGFVGDLEIHVDGQQIFSRRLPQYQFHYIPVTLRQGWHRVRIRGELETSHRCQLYFGGQGTLALNEGLFKHRP